MSETRTDDHPPAPDPSRPRPLRVLLLALSYPDVSHDDNIYTDLGHALVEQGVELRVVAPSVGTGVGRRLERSVVVVRVKTGRLFNVGLIRKGFENLALPFRYRQSIDRHLKGWRPDWIITPTPPITLGPLVTQLKRRLGAKAYVILRDIFPQNAVDLGLITKDARFHFFRRMERRLYEAADLIGCMSPGNVRYVLQHNPGLDPERVTVLPNWIGGEALTHGIDRRLARGRWGAQDHDFLCVFGGNLGRPQRVGFLLDVATEMRDERRVKFVIVGDGTERVQVERLIEERRLVNVTLHPKLPRDEYQSLLAAADLGIITLHEAFTIPNIPSRLLGYWAAGVPVLAATDAATDLDEAFLRKHAGGVWTPMGDAQAFVRAVASMMERPQETRMMGSRGRDAVRENYVADEAARRLVAAMETQ